MFLLSGWLQSAAYSLLLGDSLLSDRTTWGHLWGRQVSTSLFCSLDVEIDYLTTPKKSGWATNYGRLIFFSFYHSPLTDHDCHNSQDYNRCSLDHRHNKNLGLAQVDLIVSILPSAAKDELSLFSRYKLNNQT